MPISAFCCVDGPSCGFKVEVDTVDVELLPALEWSESGGPDLVDLVSRFFIITASKG